MNIVFLNIYQGLVARGAERSTEELCRRLSIRHQITLIQGGKYKANVKFRIVSIPVFIPNLSDSSFGSLRKFYLDLWSLQILIFTLLSIPLLLKSKIDILLPVNGGWQILICKIISLVKSCKLVVIGRAGIGRDDAWNLLLRPDLFIALTKRAGDWAKKRSQSINITILPNGVNLKKFNLSITPVKEELFKPIIISAASLTPNKRLDLAIKAVSKMKYRASLLLLGTGPLSEELKRMGLNLLGKSRFKIMDTTFENIAFYYRSGKLFTLASVETEAFGNVYLEAMACNLPVVVPEGYRREIIGKAGIYFQPDNVNDYAQKLDQALEKDFDKLPLLQAKKFSWDNIYPQYEKVFIQLLGKN